jgi:cobalt-zinc-cadmium resistance protein CzcA
MAYKLSFREVMAALAANNANVGAGYIERNGEQYLVRTPGQVANIDEIKQIVIGSRNGVPVRISDVADVRKAKIYGLVRPRSTEMRSYWVPRCS